MQKTFKYRLFPKKSQQTKLNNTLEICRQVYNKTLAIRKELWEAKQESLGLYDTNKLLTSWKKDRPDFGDVYTQVLQNAQERVDLALKAFFRRVRAGEKLGYPHFKGYGRYDSFTFKQHGFKLDGDLLALSKIGNVKIKLHRSLEGKIKTLTVQRDRLGKWYACFSCVVEPEPLPLVEKFVGIDLGLTTFATFSDRGKIERQRWFKQEEKELGRVQRRITKLSKGSPERKKAIMVLNHIYTRITNRRNDFSHKESLKLVNSYQLIVFEDLSIQDMQENGQKAINKGIADVAWNQFVQHTITKAEETGRVVVLVDPKNTTQLCSGCGATVYKDLHTRIHNCPYCDLKLSRDINAAINILRRGLASLAKA